MSIQTFSSGLCWSTSEVASGFLRMMPQAWHIWIWGYSTPLRSHQRCSIKFNKGLWWGHSRTLICPSATPVLSQLCAWSLFCRNFRPSLRSWALLMGFNDVYLCGFLQSVFLQPPAASQSQMLGNTSTAWCYDPCRMGSYRVDLLEITSIWALDLNSSATLAIWVTVHMKMLCMIRSSECKTFKSCPIELQKSPNDDGEKWKVPRAEVQMSKERV